MMSRLQVIGNDGTLREKTRIFVTHGIQYLPKVDRVIVIVGGSVSQHGKFTELMNSQGEIGEISLIICTHICGM